MARDIWCLEDRPTIADLELYGLRIRIINALEISLGILYVDQLKGLSEVDFMKVRSCGRRSWMQLQDALENWRAGRQTTTVEALVSLHSGGFM